MPMSFDNILGTHEQALNLQAKRAQLLGTNLANADTPGFKARDIDFKAVMASVADAKSEPMVKPMKVTHALHMQPDGYAFGAEVLYRMPMQASLDGNTVESQVEMAEFSENAMRYLTSLRIVSGRLNSLLSAFRGE